MYMNQCRFSVMILTLMLIGGLLSPSLGVSLVINGNATYTSTRDVTLSLSPPSNCSSMLLGNESSPPTLMGLCSSQTNWQLSAGDGLKIVTATYNSTWQCNPHLCQVACGQHCASYNMWGKCNSYVTDYCSYSCYDECTDSYSAANQIVLDTTGPMATISTLSDGAWTNIPELNIAGTLTDTSGIASLIINNEIVAVDPVANTFNTTVILATGPNVISVTATDLVGYSTTEIRTINYDPELPLLVITAPAENTRTTAEAVEIIGTTSESSTVAVRLNGAPTLLPATMNGSNFSVMANLSYGFNNVTTRTPQEPTHKSYQPKPFEWRPAGSRHG